MRFVKAVSGEIFNQIKYPVRHGFANIVFNASEDKPFPFADWPEDERDAPDQSAPVVKKAAAKKKAPAKRAVKKKSATKKADSKPAETPSTESPASSVETAPGEPHSTAETTGEEAEPGNDNDKREA